jgi:2-methylisocitrate lyase-like PEP mutase family enzyme
MPPRASLRGLLRQGELLVAPGIYDGISLRLAEKVGFRSLYMTGYGTVASHLGLPDAGLAGYGEMVDRVRTFSKLSSVPLICDGDTGYGGLLNVAHTVEGYEDAGAAAIQLEDQARAEARSSLPALPLTCVRHVRPSCGRSFRKSAGTPLAAASSQCRRRQPRSALRRRRAARPTF